MINWFLSKLSNQNSRALAKLLFKEFLLFILVMGIIGTLWYMKWFLLIIIFVITTWIYRYLK